MSYIFNYVFVIAILIAAVIMYKYNAYNENKNSDHILPPGYQNQVSEISSPDLKIEKFEDKSSQQNFNINEKYEKTQSCLNNKFGILMAPNIPVDPVTKYKINGKCCNEKEKKISYQNGKYKFPIKKFLYDGIWQSKENTNCNNLIQTQTWDINPKKDDIEGIYSTDNYYHIPNCVFHGDLVDESQKPPTLTDLINPCDKSNNFTMIYVEPGLDMPPIYP